MSKYLGKPSELALKFSKLFPQKDNKVISDFLIASGCYESFVNSVQGIGQASVDLARYEADLAQSLKVLQGTLDKDSNLQKLTSSVSEFLRKLAALRMIFVEQIEEGSLKDIKSLSVDILTKFPKNKPELLQDELSFQMERRDVQFLDNLRALCRAYIGLNETSNSLNFESAKDILDLRLKKVSKRNDVSDYVFGVGLEKLKSPIPDDIETIIQLIEDHYIEREGVFRISGSVDIVKKIREKMNHGFSYDQLLQQELRTREHSIPHLLKIWLRELPEPLFTYEYYDDFLQFARIPDFTTEWSMQAKGIKRVIVEKLPFRNREVLLRILPVLVSCCNTNSMMNSEAMSIVFGLNFMRPRKEDPVEVYQSTKFINKICQLLLDYGKELFPDAFERVEQKKLQRHQQKKESLSLNPTVSPVVMVASPTAAVTEDQQQTQHGQTSSPASNSPSSEDLSVNPATGTVGEQHPHSGNLGSTPRSAALNNIISASPQLSLKTDVTDSISKTISQRSPQNKQMKHTSTNTTKQPEDNDSNINTGASGAQLDNQTASDSVASSSSTVPTLSGNAEKRKLRASLRLWQTKVDTETGKTVYYNPVTDVTTSQNPNDFTDEQVLEETELMKKIVESLDNSSSISSVTRIGNKKS